MLTLETPSATWPALSSIPDRRRRAGLVGDRGKRLDIGLVNNMPDAALSSTERQFARLLQTASEEFDITLRLYGLDEVARSPQTRASMQRTYYATDHLRLSPPDALIITGTEPHASALVDEPYWSALTALIDWAGECTNSMLLSCLAAHAGVLHLNGIERRPMAAKCSGVFALDVVGEHRLVAGLGGRYPVPHSRLNGLDEGALERAGYRVLTRSPEVGVDVFIRERGCLAVFVQGHPEYDDSSLAREYRRDMARFLRGERASPPDLPRNYYGPAAAIALKGFEARAMREPSPDLMADFPAGDTLGAGEAPWRDSAVQFYRNWVRLIAERKSERQAQAAFAVRRSSG